MPFGLQISPLRRADIPELSTFLTSGLGETPCFSHEVLAWKYFDGPGGPSEDSTSSLVALSAGKIVGHIGICPRKFVLGGDGATTISTMHAIDWLGSAEHSGSGTFLMLQAFARTKTQYAVGGSDHAQAVFPKLGFDRKPAVDVFRKVLEPYYRFRATGSGLLRKCAGTLKDMASDWRSRRPSVKQIVELRPAREFTEEIDSLVRQSASRVVTCQRDHSLLNYFLRYPLPGFSGWTIHRSERLIGEAVLNVTAQGGVQVGKIVDCWLDTEDRDYWEAAVAALIDRLRAVSADVVWCYGASPDLQAAIISNGFAKATETNVYIRDRQQSLPQDLPFGLSMLEADHAIL